MSLYREAGQRGRQGLIAAAVALVIGLGVGYLLGSAGTEEPSFEDAIAGLRTDLAPVVNGLQLLGGEYRQGVRAGEVVAPTEYDGSVSNVERITATFGDHLVELNQLDPGATATLEATLEQLQVAVASKASTTEVDRLRREASSELNSIVPATRPVP